MSLTEVKRTRSKIASYCGYALIVVIVLGPLSWVLLTSFKPSAEIFGFPVRLLPQKPTLENYRYVLTGTRLPWFIFNTVVVGAVTTILSLSIAAPAAYGFSRYKFKFKYPLLVILLGLQLIPSSVNIVPYYVMISGYGLLNTRLALVLIFTSLRIPFSIWILKGYFDSLPDSLPEAARVDGCSNFGIFWHIMLPLSLPGLGAAGFLSFLAVWGQFLIPIVIASSPDVAMVGVGLYNFFGPEGQVQINALFAATVVSVLPVVIAYFLAQETFISGLARGSTKG
jgi:ABC-type glycerol-3-phosphate transport system permease component